MSPHFKALGERLRLHHHGKCWRTGAGRCGIVRGRGSDGGLVGAVVRRAYVHSPTTMSVTHLCKTNLIRFALDRVWRETLVEIVDLRAYMCKVFFDSWGFTPPSRYPRHNGSYRAVLTILGEPIYYSLTSVILLFLTRGNLQLLHRSLFLGILFLTQNGALGTWMKLDLIIPLFIMPDSNACKSK